MRQRFRTVILTIFFSLFAYLYFRLLAPLHGISALFWPLTLLIGLMEAVIAWLPLFFWMSDETETHPYEIFLERLAHLSMGFLSQLLFLTVVRDLVMAALALFGHAALVSSPEIGLYLIGASAVLGLLGFLVASQGPKVRRVSVAPNSGSSAGIEPLRIVHVSDLHVGVWIGKRYVNKVVRQIESLGPIDLLILTGDIGDGDPKRHFVDMIPLGKIQTRIGKFAVSGNHEGYWDEAEWNARIRELGFRLLENESVFVETLSGPISIHGVSDSGADPAKALATVKSDVFSIFLAHQPKHADAAIAAGVRLQLSGHTHAGQFLPWSLFIGFVHKFAAGLYTVNGTAIYVNSGTGFWGPPFRLGTRSETTLLEFFPGVR
jgi:predicted MPP superfamily phosphohydrolase